MAGIALFLGSDKRQSVVSQPVPALATPTSSPTGSVEGKSSKDNGNLEGPFAVSRVIDGDTIELSSGQKVRYIGIDTPESVSPNSPVECFAIEAGTRNKQLVEGKNVWLESDVSEIDRYGRLLRYVWIEDPSSTRTSGWIMVNWELARGGYAYASTYPPDVKYQEELNQAQSEARNELLGLWSSCEIERKPSYVDQGAVSENQTESDGCLIKGNIDSSGEKIYHLPGCQSYDKTKIDEPRGERWFCSEKEAESAGWRKAGNCP